jgi:hypothetical protein
MNWGTFKHEYIYPRLTRLWFSIPRYIRQKNWEDVDYLIKQDGTPSKPRPFLGMVIVKTEGEAWDWNWWKHIKFIKYEGRK